MCNKCTDGSKNVTLCRVRDCFQQFHAQKPRNERSFTARDSSESPAITPMNIESMFVGADDSQED